MNKFSAAHVQRGSHVARLTCHWRRGVILERQRTSSTDAEISFGTPAHGLPAQTDAEISFGTPAHSLPAQTDAEIPFGTPVHGLPAFTDGVVFQRQPRPARLPCPPLAIVSVFHMYARLTCRRGSHVSDAEISFGTSVHGLPASTDADFSERQRTACPHYDIIISKANWFETKSKSSDHAFRPRLPATSSDHAFQPRLPTCFWVPSDDSSR